MVNKLISTATAVLAIVLSGCSSDTEYHSEASQLEQMPAVGEIPERVWLPQGWDEQTREKFWFTSQGSRIIPYRWFAVLEQPDNTELFRSVEHMEMLRYLPVESSTENPAGLPIGFVAAHDKKTGDAWVGMTCAACHTNQLNFNETKILIEGAPTLANFVLFYERLVNALNQTQKDDAKFERFARRLLGSEYNKNDASQLRKNLSRVSLAAAERLVVNDLPKDYPTDFTSYGRLDAFGNIQNAGTAFALNDLSNKNTPSGPVSYPFLWGTHQSDVVQWNASAPNTPVIGPLVRNVGEVVGVFGDLEIQKESFWSWRRWLLKKEISYSSNVDMLGLGYLESMVKTLKSPAWPAEYLPPIDTIKAARGSVLYQAKCAGCHQVIPRENESDNYTAVKVPIDQLGTDPVTAVNADRHCAKTLLLSGTKKYVLPFTKDTFRSESAAISIPVNGTVGIILNEPLVALEAGLRPLRTRVSDTKSSGRDAFTPESEAALDAEVANHDKPLTDYIDEHMQHLQAIQSGAEGEASCGDPDAKLVYKARPLNGIWATAPYLHNGSVPNLWALLQSSELRPDRFWVGSRDFDPVNVGFDISQGLSEFNVIDEQGHVQAGNSNAGHDYGVHWTDDEKWSVIEYMKTL